MKKKILAALIATMTAGTVTAMAAPCEIEQGKWDVSVGANFSPDVDGASAGSDGDTGLYGTVTYGITDQWAIQYDYNHYDWVNVKSDANELNVLYKMTPHLNAFAGYVYHGADVQGSALSGGSAGGAVDSDSPSDSYPDVASARTAQASYDGSDSANGFQVGVEGWYPLADKWNLNGKFAIGTDNQVYQIGLGYDVAENWTLDVAYRYAEYEFSGSDIEFDGFRAGVSTSF